jgi:hypothetical protein
MKLSIRKVEYFPGGEISLHEGSLVRFFPSYLLLNIQREARVTINLNFNGVFIGQKLRGKPKAKRLENIF